MLEFSYFGAIMRYNMLMKRAEFITRIAVVVLSLFSIVAVILQVINDNTGPLETAYEIITFLVAVVALVLAIGQGTYNMKLSNELKEVIHEMHEVMKAEKTELKMEEKLAKEIEEDLKIKGEDTKKTKEE